MLPLHITSTEAGSRFAPASAANAARRRPLWSRRSGTRLMRFSRPDTNPRSLGTGNHPRCADAIVLKLEEERCISGNTPAWSARYPRRSGGLRSTARCTPIGGNGRAARRRSPHGVFVLVRVAFRLSRTRDSVAMCPQAWRARGAAPLAVAVQIRDLPPLDRVQYGLPGRRQRRSDQRRRILPRDEAHVPQFRGELGLRQRDGLQARAVGGAQRADQTGDHVPERQVGRATNRVQHRVTRLIGAAHQQPRRRRSARAVPGEREPRVVGTGVPLQPRRVERGLVMRSQPRRIAPRRFERGRRVLRGTPRVRVGRRARPSRPAGSDVQQPDRAVHQPATVGDGQHEPLQRPDPPESGGLQHGARRIVRISIEKIDVTPCLDVVPGPPHQRASREERPVGLRHQGVHQQRAGDVARPETEPPWEAGNVHHDLPRTVTPQPTHASGAHRYLVRPVEELGELGATICHEQPLDLLGVIERVNGRDRELHGTPRERHLLLRCNRRDGGPLADRLAEHAPRSAGRIPARGNNQAGYQRNHVRFLITGGAGFIGSHLVEHLVAAGHDVTVLDDLSSGSRANLAAVRRQIRFIRGSVTDLNTCRRAAAGVDCVLHHAAVTSVQRSVDEPLVTHQVNATGTLNVLLAAREKGVRRVVYAASTSAYGNPDTLPNSEEHVTRPLSPYAASKLAGEEYCVAFHATYGLETVVLRYFNIFGPRQDPNSQYAAVVPRFITTALAGERPTIFGDGGQTRDFVYIANIVHANLLAARAPAAAAAEKPPPPRSPPPPHVRESRAARRD